MFIMSQNLIAKEKIDQLITGYSAYAESDEVVRLIQREVSKLELPVICEKTDIGCWFFPDETIQEVN